MHFQCKGRQGIWIDVAYQGKHLKIISNLALQYNGYKMSWFKSYMVLVSLHKGVHSNFKDLPFWPFCAKHFGLERNQVIYLHPFILGIWVPRTLLASLGGTSSTQVDMCNMSEAFDL